MTGTTTEPRAPHKFEVGRQLGVGGVGYVCEGWIWRKGTKRECAIKRLHPHKRDVMHYDRFEREAILSIQLTPGHDNLVTVESYGFDRQGPYLIMERIHGTTAHHACKLIRGNWRVIWEIARATASAVSYLHDRGIVHRDVTARNILLDRRGAIKLTDLGLARGEDGTHTVEFHGTPIYSAPERLSAAPATRSTDVYSLGAVLWYLAAGEPPYETGNRGAVRLRMARPPVRLPDDTPPALAALLTRMIALEPASRPTLAEVRAIVDANCPPASAQLAEDIERITANPSAAYSTDGDVSMQATTRAADDGHQLLQFRERWRARLDRYFHELPFSRPGDIPPALQRQLLLAVGLHFRATILDVPSHPTRSPHGTGPHLIVRPTGQQTDISDAGASTGDSSSDPGAALESAAEPQRLIDTLRNFPEPYRSQAIALLSDVVSDVESNPALFQALATGSPAAPDGGEPPSDGAADVSALMRLLFGLDLDASSDSADDSRDLDDQADPEPWDDADRQDVLAAFAGTMARLGAEIDSAQLQAAPDSIARRHWGDGSASGSELAIIDEREPSSSGVSAAEPSTAQDSSTRRLPWVWFAGLAIAVTLLIGAYLLFDRAFERPGVEPARDEQARRPPEPRRPSQPPGPRHLTVELPEPPAPVQEREPQSDTERASHPAGAWRGHRMRRFQ